MPKPTKCNQCGNTIDGRNFGRFVGGVLYNLCSPGCRESNVAGVAPTIKPPRKRKPKPVGHVSEQQISKAIEQRLNVGGYWNTRLNAGRVRVTYGATGKVHTLQLCRTGTPDRFAALGLPVFIEIKTKGETPTPDQVAAADELRASGCLVFAVDSIEQWFKVQAAIDVRKLAIRAIGEQVAWLQKEIDDEVAGNDGHRSDEK